MKYRTLTVIQCTMLVLVAITAYCTVIAQEPTKALTHRGLGIPGSKGGMAKQGNDPEDAGSSANGWLLFDKCIVFAWETVELPSQETGAIASLDVRENDAVSANQVIAKLDGKIAELEKSAAGLQAQVAASEAQDVSEIKLAEAFVEETKLQVDLYEEMLNKGTASRTEFRQKQLAAEQAKVRLIQSNTSRQQRELKSKLAQSAVILGQQKVDRLNLRSPITGTVTRVDHRAGEWVQAGTTVMQIIQLDEVRIDCFVNVDQIDRSRLIGKRVKVISKSETTEMIFSGQIAWFDQEITSAGKIKLHARVQNQKTGDAWSLLPGMEVSMQLQKPQ